MLAVTVFGDDDDGGRCYCGQKRYPRGGPMEHDNQTFKAVFGEEAASE